MTPPRARSWGRKGSTPVVRVRGRGSGRVPIAGSTCYKPGKRSRTFYSVREYRDRKGEPKGIGGRDLCDLPVRAHIQLGGPIVLVWDNLRMHLVEAMRRFIADHADWLTVFQLPSYATGLNPKKASGHWSNVTSTTSPQPTSARSLAPSSAGSSRSSTVRTWSTTA
ncbi:transposase [Streptomyces sp. NPDC053513]|uniref:transposase n=1 Tax=unclassified Streptomyces TaxID=2593676 RepID=UPI0037CDD72B